MVFDSRIPIGAGAGLIGGGITGAAAIAQGAAGSAQWWGLWLLQRDRKPLPAVAFSLGLLLGLLDWVAWNSTAVPLLSGHVPTWSIGAAVAGYDELVRTGLLGALVGVLYCGLAAAFGTDPEPAASRKPHVVIVGGGFGGVAAARRMDALIARGLDINVTVISDSNSLLFTPLLVGVAAGALADRHVSAPVRAALAHASFLHGRVNSIDTASRNAYVTVVGGGPQRVPYDHLVLAVGAVPHYFDLPGVGDNAFALKSIEDADRLRNHVLGVLERADAEPDPAEQDRLLTFVVVGGGFAGTELIAELFDLIHDVRHYYPRLHGLSPRCVLVHSGDRLLPELPGELGDYALSILRERGIDFRLGARLVGADARGVRLGTGEELPTATLAWTAGNRPNPLAGALGAATDRGALVVDATMRVPALDGVWAVGDCARIPDPAQTAGWYPPTAQHALREGKTVADNIAAVIGERAPRPFRFGALGVLVSLGHQRAAGLVLGRRVSGFTGWILWRAVYLSKLPGGDKRLRVLADWLLDLVFPRDIALIRDAAPGPGARVPAATPVAAPSSRNRNGHE
ncbi:NAD(P)/FAD-dependent oxidoreductase [Nocardia sp. NEAU-G5]|uniref:NAD(P)/FAD-dependent oxidoreductase n=1 Tax=Nocardia albiluteola TaxID=2842303 RepID=A0ABS6B0S7_9NOCA|nr:NAD(P)/FAD-dependent oxidoreductase [Nocardia albiluteola]MBU3063907.1 NAD(P)/FAD-dependent oxidoreductase [Nocardia albiluteola]